MAEEISSREQSEIQTARQTLLIARWLFPISLLLACASAFWGRISNDFLAAAAIVGAIWFVLLVAAWRFRSEALRMLSLIFVISAMLGLSQHYSCSFQAGNVAIATGTGLMVLLRAKVRRFARI